MQKIKVFLLIVTLIGFTSCNKEGELGNLPGTWLLSKVSVDGKSSEGTGSIIFGDNNQGQMDFGFKIDNNSLSYAGTFFYNETVDLVVLDDRAGNSLNFTRITNTATKQVFKLSQVVNSTSRNVQLEFTK